MTDSDTERPRHGRGRRFVLGSIVGALALTLSLALVAVAALGALAASETRLAFPAGLVARIEDRIDARLTDMDIELGDVSVMLDRRLVPRLFLEGVSLRDAGGADLAELAEVGVAIDAGALLSGRVAPRILRVAGARLVVRRDARGRFEFTFGGGGDAMRFDNPGAVLDAVEARLAAPPFDRVESVTLYGTQVSLEDARSSRVWQLTDGNAELHRQAGGVALSVAADLFNGGDDLARLEADLSTAGDDGSARARIALDGIEARDIAAQSPVLSVLRVLDAPLSARLEARLGPDGTLGGLDGTLEIGAGALNPRAETRPIPFDSARVDFGYDPARKRIDMTELKLVSDDASGRASGHAYLTELGPGGMPGALLVQIAVQEARIGAATLFADPVTVTDGSADLRLRLNPLTVEVGRWSLPGPGGGPEETVAGTARVVAGPDGWRADLDLGTGRLAADRLAELWPLPVARMARNWFANRVSGGVVLSPRLALRFRPGMDRPEVGVTFGFEGADVRAVDFMPPVTRAAGYGSLFDGRFAVRMDAGRMAPEGRGAVDLAGSTFSIPDMRQQPAEGVLDLAADGPLGSVLALIDRPPLRLLDRVGRGPDLATGRVTGTTRIALPLRRGVTPQDITYDAKGEIRDFASDSAVPGRELAADRLAVTVDRQAIRAEGQATLDGVGFDGTWRQALSGEDAGTGRVEGHVALSPDGLRRFGVTLPDGLVSGSGQGDLTVRLGDGVPRIALASDLRGIGLRIAAVNWSKPAAAGGTFRLSGRLGKVPQIDRLSLEAPGLSARGRVELSAGPAFRALRLDRVALGGWLDGAVTVAARGPGQPPAISVTGGRVDLRRAQLGGSGSGSGGGTARGPVTLRLDRLTITDTLALTAAAVDLAPGRGLSGAFSGRMNGGVGVSGTLTGEAGGVAVQLASADAGALLRDAGLFRRVEGGRLNLTLRPTGARGTYDGQVRVTDPVLRDAPAIAELLSAISVVGLLEQLGGAGIPFDEVSAEFRLSPRQITLYRSSATGNSLGLSMDGVYDPVTRRMDMQGVVSPVYLLNRVGAIFTRRGEGLFGVNFTLKGPVSDPSVGVNPLSILTPGMFRDIFRRPPPARPSQ
ncbi:AsmA-like C-terminal region-containing protein [Palleronia rufa]|uniref:AsmA-like C-terminal region-containing protein n=1 Tax=Palleronia rufa TaxID=1530186 RepID=UPI00056AA3F8|nr:AsmA-like C-terminal region-containing protein [Palleronia rufa]